MFGFVTANWKELTKQQQDRYGGVYCGICRQIKQNAASLARMTLSYDMAFLALLLMSLYEPEETAGPLHCPVHPFRRRDWADNEMVRYAADMNVALAYYKCLDDWHDDGSAAARLMAKTLAGSLPELQQRYPRQTGAMDRCIRQLSILEQEGCPNPDEPAAVFGELLGELLVFTPDLWEKDLRALGFHLGRFIYLADAAVDYRADRRKGKYNPYLAMDTGEDWSRWEEYLVLAMGRCTDHYEKLPLVQDKHLLDNILYSGVWTNFRAMGTKAREKQ